MDLCFPLSTRPIDLARIIAALANSGGGRCTIIGEYRAGRELLRAALDEIIPGPGYSESGAYNPQKKVSGLIRPPRVDLSSTDKGLIVSVVRGDSLCTVDGVVFVFEKGAIRALSITEVVRISGSGG